MMHSVQRRGHQRPIVIMNSGSESIPAFAAMEVRDVDLAGRIWVRKPQTDDLPPQRVLINGPISIEPYGSGTAQGSFPFRALYHLDDGTADNRDTVGTRSGYWQLHQGYEGFIVWGQPDDSLDQIIVQPDMTCRDLTSGNYLYYGGVYPCFCCHCCGCDRFRSNDNIPGTVCVNQETIQLNATVSMPCIGTRTITLDRSFGDGFSHSVSCNPQFPYTPARYVEFSGSYASYGGPNGNNTSPCDPSVAPSTALIDVEQLSIKIMCEFCPGGVSGVYSGSDKGNSCISGDPSAPIAKSPCALEPPSSATWHAIVSWTKFSGTLLVNVDYDGPITLVNCNPLSFSVKATNAICSTSGGIGFPTCTPAVCTTSCLTTAYTPCLGNDLQLDADEI